MLKSLVLMLFVLVFSTHITAQINSHKKILIVTTSADNRLSKPDDHTWGCFTPEVTHFYARLYQAGYTSKDIDILTLKGGPVPLAVSITFPKKWRMPDDEKNALRAKLNNALSPALINADDYNVVYYAGGFSCLVDLPTSTAIAQIASQIYESGGVVAAVCDGIVGLAPIKLRNGDFMVNGKLLTTNDFRVKGYVYNLLVSHGAIINSEKFISKERIIVARGVQPVKVAEEVIKVLTTINK